MIDQIDHIIHQIVQGYEIPGLAVGIVKDNKLFYARGFGVRSLATGEPVTPASLFHLASVSKPFVATAVVQLVERGQVDLDAPVVNYLPYFKLDDERYTTITVRQMLSHISGMPDTDEYGWEQPDYDEGALERYVRSLSHESLIAAPGEKFAYSNIAYEVLGDLIAKVSAQPFEQYITENILRPLGMTQSTFLKTEVPPELEITPHLSLPHPTISTVYPYNRAHAPSSTLHSNVLEMANWAIANLNKGRLGDKQILNPTSYELLWRPYASISEDESAFAGLSWFISDYKGFKLIDHSGEDVGFETNLALLPEKGLAVIVLANTIPAPVRRVTEVVLDSMLGFEPEVPKPLIIMTLARLRQKNGPEAALKAYHQLKESQADGYDFGPAQFDNTGYLLVELKRFKEAIEILNLGIAIHPENDTLYYILALAYTQDGTKELAVETVQHCLKLNPDHREAKELLKTLQPA